MDESYIIERGVPIPPSTSGKKRGHKQGGGVRSALHQMSVGDSIVIDQRHRFSLSGHCERVGVKIVSRSLDDGRVRVWVTERSTPVKVLTPETASAIGDRTAGEVPHIPPAQAVPVDSATGTAGQ